MKFRICFLLAMALVLLLSACTSNNVENQDTKTVERQQKIYQDVQPVHIYDYSIPRDIYQQIYDVITTKVVATYTVVETITGVTKFQCPSVGYAIPADTSLTNPLRGVYNVDTPAVPDEFSVVVEQAEPNGLYSSKNTDGTWVLCVDTNSSEVYPFYTEHKVSVAPFIMEKNSDDEWIRADNKPIAFKIEVRDSK